MVPFVFMAGYLDPPGRKWEVKKMGSEKLSKVLRPGLHGCVIMRGTGILVRD
jgi:hypothetical protein